MDVAVSRKTLYGLAGLAGLAALTRGGAARASFWRARGPAMTWDAFRALCERWAARWGLPALYLEVIGSLESGRNPGDANLTDARALGRGGAWGLFGVTLATARDLVARKGPGLRDIDIVRSWQGTGPELLNPELNAAIAGYYLLELYQKFERDFVSTVAAYQQGPATVEKIRKRGGDVASEIGPHGRIYVHKAIALRDEIQKAEPVA